MRYLLVTAILLIAAVGCEKFRLPEESEMREVFAPQRTMELGEPVAPGNIPILATSEMSDWHLLCDQCHVGPHYSSFSILNWGHLDNCTTGMECTDCHAEQLHLTHVRGEKGRCIECHIAREVPASCGTCHPQDWRESHTPHDPVRTGRHGLTEEWAGFECITCHGSERWCINCHGLPMPHPEDIVTSHPQLIQGNPQACANCHGRHSCVVCHDQRGITIETPLGMPPQ